MTVSSPEYSFPSAAGKPVVANFDGGDITSNAGALLVGQADKKIGLSKAIAGSINDTRDQARVRHSLGNMVSARVLAIIMGYEDGNDMDFLRDDVVNDRTGLYHLGSRGMYHARRPICTSRAARYVPAVSPDMYQPCRPVCTTR